MEIFRTALPMRSFTHAAAKRQKAEAIVVRLRTKSGRVGFGEALPRRYVTGETLETVIDDLERIFWPILREADSPEAAVEQLPCTDGDRIITAARCAAELAAISVWDIRWQGSTPRRAQPARVSGVLGSDKPRKTAKKLRHMRWFGLRDFKLKLGFEPEIDRANLRVVCKQLGDRLKRAECTLRVDVNGAWPIEEVPQRIAELKPLGVCAVEQPCWATAGQLADLAYDCDLPLIADESMLTEQHAEYLFGADGRVWLNIRLAKNGGLIPALRIANQAAAERVPFVLGCLVGESGILSLAQRAFLTAAPPAMMIEGNYGRYLLKDDLTVPSPRFGFGGQLAPADDGRLIARPRRDRFKRYARLVKRLA